MSTSKKMMRYKALAVLLAFVMVFAFLGPVPVSAASEEVNVAQFTYDGEIYGYPTIAEAIEIASTVGNPDIYVIESHTLPGKLTIPAGQKVIIPTSDAYNDTNTGVANVTGNGTTTTAYVTLTVPDGVNLEVNGTLLVAGNQQSTQPRTGFLTGSYGAINLEGDIVVNGTLYARGEISGTGTVTANRGGAVYQRFEIADWRGGTASQAAYVGQRDESGEYVKRVFPFNLYTLNGILTKEIYESGAELYGQAFVSVSVFGANLPLNVTVPYISHSDDETGTSNGYLVTTSDTGRVVLTKDNGTTTFTIDGTTIDTGTLSFNYSIGDFSSANLVAPFGYQTNVVIDNGGVLNVNSELKFLPGSHFTVENGTVNIGENGAFYFYGAGAYSENYFFHRVEPTWDYSAEAVLTNNGTINVAGKLGSTDENFSNITGIDHTPNETVTIYEYQQVATSEETVGPKPVDFHVYTPNPTPTPDPDPTPAE